MRYVWLLAATLFYVGFIHYSFDASAHDVNAAELTVVEPGMTSTSLTGSTPFLAMSCDFAAGHTNFVKCPDTGYEGPLFTPEGYQGVALPVCSYSLTPDYMQGLPPQMSIVFDNMEAKVNLANGAQGKYIRLDGKYSKGNSYFSMIREGKASYIMTVNTMWSVTKEYRVYLTGVYAEQNESGTLGQVVVSAFYNCKSL